MYRAHNFGGKKALPARFAAATTPPRPKTRWPASELRISCSHYTSPAPPRPSKHFSKSEFSTDLTKSLSGSRLLPNVGFTCKRGWRGLCVSTRRDRRDCQVEAPVRRDQTLTPTLTHALRQAGCPPHGPFDMSHTVLVHIPPPRKLSNV